MATNGIKLVMKFKDTSGDPWSISFNNANTSATVAQVKALADGIITNKTIWEGSLPATKVSAQFVTTSVTDVDVIS